MAVSDLATLFTSPEFFSGLVTGALVSKTAREVVAARLRSAWGGSSSRGDEKR